MDRRQLAQALCDRLVSRYGDQVLVGGLYGSTARGTDTPWSDLEMLFVVADGSAVQGRHFLYQGTAAGYRVYRLGELEQLVSHPGPKWPFHMGMLDTLQVIHGDPARVQRWLTRGSSLPRERFLAALETHLPGLVVEAHGRLHSSLRRGELEALRPSVLEMLFEMKTALCLLNGSWTTHDYYRGLEDTFAFPRLPEGYEELVPELYHTLNPPTILSLADRLTAAFWRLVDSEGIRVRNHTTVAEIPV
jgi:kanamycin nucleotidyltransferase